MNTISFLFGGGMTVLDWYLIVVGLDIITGYMKGLKSHQWNSAFNLKGLLKKFGSFATIIVAAMIDDIAPAIGMSLPVSVAFYWTVLLIIYEGLSILENYKELGGKGFNFLAKYLEVFENKVDEDKDGKDK
ncbi:phage holin family protein [Listeria booriae]|uniref:phage holin family protein n=1 Tax=Listeria booriae TaxID=1552123 RepID=UPI0016251C72|nr:phage holin family protein [Listeria booriae]MBC1974569.1 phage holin family protein [Listeria booriae]MBC1983501.1 phage holin family protein [Listeria booriae]MBC2031861.1 phage holin family protein [Listeria booriae]